jgi:hypothetical protein
MTYTTAAAPVLEESTGYSGTSYAGNSIDVVVNSSDVTTSYDIGTTTLAASYDAHDTQGYGDKTRTAGPQEIASALTSGTHAEGYDGDLEDGIQPWAEFVASLTGPASAIAWSESAQAAFETAWIYGGNVAEIKRDVVKNVIGIDEIHVRHGSGTSVDGVITYNFKVDLSSFTPNGEWNQSIAKQDHSC